MKKLIIFSLMSCVCYAASAQFVYKIKADSVKITNDSCSAELILENSTKATKGFLYNYGNGRTRFQQGLIRLNDSMYIIGADTLKVPTSLGTLLAMNGLNRSGDTIKLGGDLLAHTNINLKDKRLRFYQSDNTYTSSPTGGITITGAKTNGNGNDNLYIQAFNRPESTFSGASVFAETFWQPTGTVTSGSFTNYISSQKSNNANIDMNGLNMYDFRTIFYTFSNQTFGGRYHFYAGGSTGADPIMTNHVGLYVSPLKRPTIANAYAIKTDGADDSIYNAGPVRWPKYKNNATEDSVLTTDVNGNIKMKLAGSGGPTIYTGDGSITGTRNVNFSSIGGGISFNMKTATDASFTRSKNSYFMTNPDWGGRVFATYMISDDDSALTGFSVVNDGGGANRGNELGAYIAGSKTGYNFGGQTQGSFIRSDRQPITVIADNQGNPAAAYPIQFYTGTNFFQNNTNSIPTLRMNGDQTVDIKSKTRIGSSTDQGSYNLQVTGDSWSNGKMYFTNPGSFAQTLRIGWSDDINFIGNGSIHVKGPLYGAPVIKIDSFTYGGNGGVIDISSHSAYNYASADGTGSALRLLKTAMNGTSQINYGAIYVDHKVHQSSNSEALYSNYTRTRSGSNAGYSYYANATVLSGGTGTAYAFYADSGYSYFRQNIGLDILNPQYNLDVNGTARVSSLPFLASRDTVLTYDPSTKQLKVTKLSGGGASTLPAGSNGQVQFNNSGSFGASSNLHWDNTNNRLGISTSSPQYSLDINGTARVNTVPYVDHRDTILTYDPVTKQLKATGTYSRVLLASDVNSSSGANTLGDVTGLSFPVSSGATYKFRFFIVYTANSANTGSRWTINGPSLTALHYMSEYSLSTTSTTVNQGLNAYNSPANNNNTSATTGSNIAIIEGVVTPSASGTIIARFASESATSGTIVAKGTLSYVEFERIN